MRGSACMEVAIERVSYHCAPRMGRGASRFWTLAVTPRSDADGRGRRPSGSVSESEKSVAPKTRACISKLTVGRAGLFRPLSAVS